MCEPIVTTMMLGASVAQTALGVAQQSQQAQEAAAQQASRAWQTAYQTAYQTATARNAATVSEYNAQDAERRGAVEEERQRRKTSLLLGTLQARLAVTGLRRGGSDLSGSPLDLLGDTAALGEAGRARHSLPGGAGSLESAGSRPPITGCVGRFLCELGGPAP